MQELMEAMPLTWRSGVLGEQVSLETRCRVPGDQVWHPWRPGMVSLVTRCGVPRDQVSLETRCDVPGNYVWYPWRPCVVSLETSVVSLETSCGVPAQTVVSCVSVTRGPFHPHSSV